MNARSILSEGLRKKIADLSVSEIRELNARLERDSFELRIFLKVFDANKKRTSTRRRLPRHCLLLKSSAGKN
jgi:hypothetical protein